MCGEIQFAIGCIVSRTNGQAIENTFRGFAFAAIRIVYRYDLSPLLRDERSEYMKHSNEELADSENENKSTSVNERSVCANLVRYGEFWAIIACSRIFWIVYCPICTFYIE